MLAAVKNLLKENQSELLTERRNDRKPFVRPVTIRAGRNRDTVAFAFSREISSVGIGLISQVEWKARTQATIEVISIEKQEVYQIAGEARWTRPFGQNWYYTGWKFVDEKP